MAVGTVKWFSDPKGFGFIECDQVAEDVFAHYTAIVSDGFRTLQVGAQVSFDLVQLPKGCAAANIRLLVEPTAAPTDIQGAPASTGLLPINEVCSAE